MLKNAFVLIAGLGLAGCVAQPRATVADSENRVVDIVNTSATPLAFYAVKAERPRAFRARFAEQEVAAAYYSTVNFDDQSGSCLYNLYVSAPSGAMAEVERFDVCREVAWVITPEMLQ